MTYTRKFLIKEGIHDQGTHKIVFMAGGTGNGKDFVMKKALGGLPLTEINSDHAFSHLMRKKGLDLKMPDEEIDEREPLRKAAKNMTASRLKMLFDGRHGLIINGTGDDADKIKLMKDEFEKQGYDTSMVFVHSANEVSKARNIARGLKGDREVPEEIRQEKWKGSVKNMDHYKKLFGDQFHLVDASKDAFGTPEERADREGQHMEVFRKIKNFVETPSRLSAARDWYRYNSNLRGLDHKEVERHKFAKLTPHERRFTNPPREDTPLDYQKLSNYSLGARKHFGDKKAGGLLTQRQRQKESTLRK